MCGRVSAAKQTIFATLAEPLCCHPLHSPLLCRLYACVRAPVMSGMALYAALGSRAHFPMLVLTNGSKAGRCGLWFAKWPAISSWRKVLALSVSHSDIRCMACALAHDEEVVGYLPCSSHAWITKHCGIAVKGSLLESDSACVCCCKIMMAAPPSVCSNCWGFSAS